MSIRIRRRNPWEYLFNKGRHAAYRERDGRRFVWFWLEAGKPIDSEAERFDTEQEMLVACNNQQEEGDA